jgi:hypothetical protein
VTLRNSAGPQVDFNGRIRGAVCGRVRPPFKTFPRYYDLFLFEAEDGELICQRRWVSEAHEEDPAVYDVVRAPNMTDLEDVLLNYDAAKYATNLWPDDVPGGMRRSLKTKKWIAECYAERVRALCDEWHL